MVYDKLIFDFTTPEGKTQAQETLQTLVSLAVNTEDGVNRLAKLLCIMLETISKHETALDGLLSYFYNEENGQHGIQD